MWRVESGGWRVRQECFDQIGYLTGLLLLSTLHSSPSTVVAYTNPFRTANAAAAARFSTASLP